MFHSLAEFYPTYEQFTSGTLKLFGALTDKSLDCCVTEGHRSTGQAAWHIVTSIPEMMSHTGLGLSSVDYHAPRPKKAAEIVSAYRRVSDELLSQIKKNWTDETLKVADDMYGSQWPRGLTLRILLDHEIHHRGQLTVLMRNAGLVVPGIFGPAKEEWAKFGGQPPEN